MNKLGGNMLRGRINEQIGGNMLRERINEQIGGKYVARAYK
jgi:hypothetical protein